MANAKYDLNDNSVVVVVGSGAGGGTLANELCQKGDKVVCLEAGPWIQNKGLTQDDYVNDEFTMFGRLSGEYFGKTGHPTWLVKAVGGSTIHWAGGSIRFNEHEFQSRTTYGDVKGASLMDWPLTLKELEPYYSKAEDKLGVTRRHGIPGLPGNNNYKVLEAGARKVGYTDVDTGFMAVNSQQRDGRSGCLQIGFCFQGCKSQAKWSTLYVDITKALETGKLELRPDSQALQIQHDKSGKVTGVLYANAQGKQVVQKARAVCVAGNSIESPRLLLNSASSQFPDGLANSSGQVGRNYMRHTTGRVFATFAKPVHMYRGTTMAGIVRDEAGNKPARGFAGGYYLQTISLGFPFHTVFMQPGGWGREFTHLMDLYANTAGLWIVGEDLPQAGNGVTLDKTAKDKYGMPVAHLKPFEDHPNDAAMRNHAFKSSSNIYEAAGATEVLPQGPYPSTHNMGTNRMSAKAGDGVVNKWGQAHDVKNLFVSDGSQFTSGAACNPTLTIVTLAIRQAEYIHDQMGKGAI